MALTLRGFVDLPPHAKGGFDHGDVHLESGRVFVAHTDNGTVEIIDWDRGLSPIFAAGWSSPARSIWL